MEANGSGRLHWFSVIVALIPRERRRKGDAPFPNHPKVRPWWEWKGEKGMWISTLMAPSQIRRLKADQGLDHNVTEVPRHFRTDQGSISLLEKSMWIESCFSFKVRTANYPESEFNNGVSSDHPGNWMRAYPAPVPGCTVCPVHGKTSWEDRSLEIMEIATGKPSCIL